MRIAWSIFQDLYVHLNENKQDGARGAPFAAQRGGANVEAIMSGVKGKSGGYRPGAGRKPRASTIDKKAKAKKVESLGEAAPLPDTIKFKKLTAFFAKPTTDTVSTAGC